MMTLLGISNQGNYPFGLGLGGFLNGEPLGSQQQKPLAGILNRNGLSQPTQGGNSLLSPLSLLPQSLKPKEKTNSPQDEKEKDPEKKDRVDLSKFAEDAAQKAVDNAKKQPQVGSTNQIFVSQDGRFEASIDLQVRADGSYDMELAIKFAQSQSTRLDSALNPALPDSQQNQQNTDIQQQPADLQYQSTQASVSRYTSFEQELKTRDLQAKIFFEESKSVALKAEQAYGQDAGNGVLSTAQEVAHEFNLNISISGKDINNFNAAAADLTQFDDSGTLSGFLQAVGNVLNSDSSNLGSFLDATRGLIDATQQHVSAKLNNFFDGIQKDYGKTLEDLGFSPDFLKNVGQDVQKDLNSFFSITNQLLGGNGNGAQAIGNKDDVKNSEWDVLQQNLEMLKEKRKTLSDIQGDTNKGIQDAQTPLDARKKKGSEQTQDIPLPAQATPRTSILF